MSRPLCKKSGCATGHLNLSSLSPPLAPVDLPMYFQDGARRDGPQHACMHAWPAWSPPPQPALFMTPPITKDQSRHTINIEISDFSRVGMPPIAETRQESLQVHTLRAAYPWAAYQPSSFTASSGSPLCNYNAACSSWCIIYGQWGVTARHFHVHVHNNVILTMYIIIRPNE